MFSAFTNSFKIPELRQRILFTAALIFVCRLIAIIPTPGVNAGVLSAAMERMASGAGIGLLGMLDLFAGGALATAAIGALGIMPSISSSIILQLLTAVVPALEKLAREGDAGRQKIIQYGRYLTVVLCIVQGYAFSTMILHPELLGIQLAPGESIISMNPLAFRLLAILTMTTGTMLLMWLGEQITARGIGNGLSLIITISIVSRLPGAIHQSIEMLKTGSNVLQLALLILVAFLVIAGVVAITQAQRKIPVQYAKRVVGRKTYGGQSTYMPLRVNYSGVMPIIFASAIMQALAFILTKVPIDAVKRFSASMFQTAASPWYLLAYGLMILFFSYFWVATQFHPVQIADDLKKYGGYVPGIRPGKPTAEFLDRVMTRITLAGAVFLTGIAVLPIVLGASFNVPGIVAQFFGGTSLLIIVGVMLDTMRQIESHLVTRHYDGFLRKGHLRGRR